MCANSNHALNGSDKECARILYQCAATPLGQRHRVPQVGPSRSESTSILNLTPAYHLFTAKHSLSCSWAPYCFALLVHSELTAHQSMFDPLQECEHNLFKRSTPTGSDCSPLSSKYSWMPFTRYLLLSTSVSHLFNIVLTLLVAIIRICFRIDYKL